MLLCLNGNSNMMTFQVKTAIPPAKVLISSGAGSNCSLHGPDVPQYPAALRELRTMGASGGQAAVRHNIQLKRFPVIQPLNKPRDEKSLFTTFIVGGSSRLAKDDLPPQANYSEEVNLGGRPFLCDQMCVIPERTRSFIPPLPREYNVHRTGNLHNFHLSKGLTHTHKTGPFILESAHFAKDDLSTGNNTKAGMNISGRHFLFDENCVIPERTRSMIPPLPREYNVHRSGNLHHFSLSKGLSQSLRTGPFILDCPDQSELTTTAICVPSSLVINGRNTFPVGNYKLNRPKGNNQSTHLQTVKENQKNQTYPDPVVKAPRPYLNRMSELSSLQCETVRQERMKKMKKPKPSS